MNKNDIIDKVSRVTCAKKEAADAVNEFISVIKQALANNKRVTISGFGSFVVRNRKARKGVNPRTGKQIHIKEKATIKFKSAKNILADKNKIHEYD